MDISTLREQTQKEKLEGRSRPWGYRALQRGPSIYITALLLRTNITPTTVTVAGLVLGVCGAFLLTGITLPSKLFGLLLIYGNILADKVDGELARARGTHSLKGVFLDELNHLIIPSFVFAGLSYGLIATAGSEVVFLGLAFIIGPWSLAIIRAMHNIIPALYTKKILKYADRFALDPLQESPETKTQSPSPLLLIPLRALHQFQDLLVFIVTIAILLIVDTLLTANNLISLHVYPLTSYAVIFFSLLYVAIIIEDIIKGYRSVEHKLSRIVARSKDSNV